MRPNETKRVGLPATVELGSRPFLFSRGAPKAAFLSQLIAERHHLAPQRVKRRAPIDDALRTYDAAGRIAVRRLPPGYRLDIDA